MDPTKVKGITDWPPHPLNKCEPRFLQFLPLFYLSICSPCQTPHQTSIEDANLGLDT